MRSPDVPSVVAAWVQVLTAAGQGAQRNDPDRRILTVATGLIHPPAHGPNPIGDARPPARGAAVFIKRDARVDAIADLDIFAGLDRKQLATIASLTTEITLPAGSVLCRRGERGREAFVLVRGSVAVSVDDQAVAALGPGAVVGEMSLLDGEPRVATVTATSAVSVLVLSPLELASLLESVPAVRSRILSTLGARKKDLATAA